MSHASKSMFHDVFMQKRITIVLLSGIDFDMREGHLCHTCGHLSLYTMYM